MDKVDRVDKDKVDRVDKDKVDEDKVDKDKVDKDKVDRDKVDRDNVDKDKDGQGQGGVSSSISRTFPELRSSLFTPDSYSKYPLLLSSESTNYQRLVTSP